MYSGIHLFCSVWSKIKLVIIILEQEDKISATFSILKNVNINNNYIIYFSIKSTYLDFLLNCCTFDFVTFSVGIGCSKIPEGKVLSIYYESQTIPDAKFYQMFNPLIYLWLWSQRSFSGKQIQGANIHA